MRVITKNHSEFPHAHRALTKGRAVGSYDKNGGARHVRVYRHLIVISCENNSSYLGLHTARSHTEANILARRLLERENRRGLEVAFAA